MLLAAAPWSSHHRGVWRIQEIHMVTQLQVLLGLQCENCILQTLCWYFEIQWDLFLLLIF